MPSITTENYLKAIYQLREKHPEAELVKLGEIAMELGLTPGTITTMIKSLAKRDWVEYQPRSGVRLTPTGHAEALKVVRRHRLIEQFLVKVLHMDWAEVHEDAETLEHAVSDRVLDRIDAMMGYPERDPHGDPIPGRDGRVPAINPVHLNQAVSGASYVVSRIDNQDALILEKVATLGLKPGTSFRPLPKDKPDQTLQLQLDSDIISVPTDLAACIRIKALS